MTTPDPSDAVPPGDDPVANATPEVVPGAPQQLVERASVRRNVGQMATSQVFTWIIATITAVIVPRILGPATLGELQLAGSLWAIVGVFAALGTSMHLQLSISRDQRVGLALLPAVFVARTIAFVIATIVLAGYVWFIDPDATFVAIVSLTGVVTLLTLWSDVLGSSFVGLERVAASAAVGVLNRLVLLVLTSGVLVAGLGAIAVVGANVAATLLGVVVLFVLFRRTVREPNLIPHRRVLGDLRPLISASIPFMAVTLALMTYRQIDVIVISRVAGDRDVGWYAAADLLAGSLFFPTAIIMAAVFPTFGRLQAHDPDQLRTFVRRVYSMLFLVAVPIGMGGALVGPAFAPLLFGDDFSGAGEALVIFSPVTILSSGTTMLAYLALATQRTRFLAWLIAGSAVATIPLDLLLVPWTAERFDNGAIGGALAYVVTELFQFVIALIVVAPYLITREWWWRISRVLAAGAIMVVAAWPFRQMFFLVPVAVGAVVYPVAAFALRAVEVDQREMLADVVGRFGIPTAWLRPR